MTEDAISIPTDDFVVEARVGCARERIFDALTTLEGLAAWWTRLVSGTPTASGELRFGFSGLDEKIVMRVDKTTPPSTVIWTCLAHTGHPEWQDTEIIFELAQHEAGSQLSFRHIGLTPALSCYETCESGWDHFLTSLLSYAQDGNGSPFSSER